MRHRAAVAGFALLPLAFACGSLAQTPNGATSDPPPQLKSSPVLEPPPPKALRLTPGANPMAPEREPIFLRADKLEGDNQQQWIEASGHAELRSRRQTVLADWLRYDIPSDQFWAKGNVILRRGIDRISGPEAKFKRSDETGFFTSPEFHIG